MGSRERKTARVSAVTILDGGMGQLLQHRSKLPPSNMWSAKSMLEEPELVSQLHGEYIEAGAEVITINAYAASPERLNERGFGDKFEALQEAAIVAAERARDTSGKAVKIAGSLPPLFNSYNPDLTTDECFARETYEQIVNAQARCDVLLAETLGSLLEVRAVLAAMQNAKQPCWVSVSLDDENVAPVLRSGEALEEAIALAINAGIDAFLLNCSAPETITRAMGVLKTAPVAFGAYANGFQKVIPLTDADIVLETFNAREDLGPEAYADFTDIWIAEGATIIGGCCETEPQHIAEIARRKEARS